MIMEQNFLKSSLHNASLNIILQVLFRCITFILNAFVIRNVSQEMVGIMYVRLLLLESTILFLSREAFRKACLSKTVDHYWPKVINLVWLVVPLCTVLSIIFGYVWLNILVQPAAYLAHDYKLGVWCIGVSCILEMCCEPLYLVSQAFLFVKFRAFVDLVTVLTRSAIFAFVVWLNTENAVLAFSIAQMTSAITYCVVFYGYFVHYLITKKCNVEFPFQSVRDFFPKILENQDQIDWKLLNLVRNFLKQGLLMQLLTEGERYVMTLLNALSFAEQGVFDVVNNLGSLAARFIFRPVEESAYFYFSQLIHREHKITDQNMRCMEEAASVLEHSLRCVTSLGLLVLVFGQSYSNLLLSLYGGQKLATGLGSKLLRTHCLAILLLAINGTTEAYALATMDSDHLNKYNKIMVVMSVSFLLANWLLCRIFGSVGFILANCCNMTGRIIHSILFIRKRYKSTNLRPLKGLVPKFSFLMALFLSAVITLISESFLYKAAPFAHFFVGAVCFFVTLGLWLYEEQELVRYGFDLLKPKQA